jgi:hypothetical protein
MHHLSSQVLEQRLSNMSKTLPPMLLSLHLHNPYLWCVCIILVGPHTQYKDGGFLLVLGSRYTR